MINENSLIILDRDGTIIEDAGYLGKNSNWESQIKLKKDVIKLILYIDKKNDCKKIIVTNQSGVARGYFNCDLVEKINKKIEQELQNLQIKIDNCQYCPDIDLEYAESHKEMSFDSNFVKEETKRKPRADMVFDALKELDMNLDSFRKILVIGDKVDDEELAKNINAEFLSVNNKTYEQMVQELRYIF